jgi:hypothetical protein
MALSRLAGLIHHFETIPEAFWKPDVHHLH